MRRAIGLTTGAVFIAATLCLGLGPIESAAADSAPGITSTTIRVGIPFIDFASLTSVGINLNEGNWEDAYKALIANVNDHGGVKGRKIVPYFTAVNPTGTTAAATACTQLVEDDDVFIAIGAEQVNCYVNQYHIPAIEGLMETQTAGSAANFSLDPANVPFDQVQIPLFAQMGVFNHKKVGLFGGQTADDPEMKAVQSDLKKLHVDVVQSATDSAPESDQVAEFQDAESIAQRFETEGVNEVVAVGTGSAVWPAALNGNQSAYNPPWVGTSGSNLAGALDTGPSNSVAPQYVKNMLAAVAVPSYVQMWKDPAVQRCASIIKKAYPSDSMATPTLTTPGSDETYEAVVQACQNLALFTKIADAAGKDLTVSSFTKAGYGLQNVTIPGLGGPVSFGPNQPGAVGQVYQVKYDSATKSLVIADAPLK